MKKILFALALTVCAIATTQAQTTKIGHVRSQALLDTMPSRKEAIKEIKAIEASGVKELRDMDSLIQVMYLNYQKNEKTWSETVKQYEQQRLQRKQQEIEERQQQIDQQLQAMTQEMNVVILDKVKKAVNIVATAKKFNYIIDESSTLYSAGGVDVTNEVIVELLKLEKK
ncbi:OmpH family outer membrane protein [Fluviicola taffensis]|uniref:Outer membrane chaperone Skp (OmpH) n=1 Tax=Fluviicola taffensis (strain DSM 16823 / NCIMB 13979 / RW262) TaxID=755732 RepID=F2IAI0_FLUTR|nr:OmpH family outer membrane protein [Fluviicola taffensis]AEA43116.1 outer membrane chaperone Skp (OmpH) [Fluviicola taffensis DSM 16823]